MRHRPRILYIDDEEDLLTLASSFFEDESLPIETATDFTEALNKIRAGYYDLIISDAYTPSGKVAELLSIIKAEQISVGKIILVTGSLDFQDENQEASFDLILYKPISFVDLLDRVKQILKI